jgi:glycosyltransferase involved in cell wall biosynthesis
MTKTKIDDNILYLLTAEFPFGSGEAFIGNEIHFLSKEFNRVVIICGVKNPSSQRLIPENVEIKAINYDYTFSLLEIIVSIFSLRLIIEFILMLFFYKKLPKFGRLKTAVTSNANTIRLKKLYSNEIFNSNLKTKKYLYSFWFNDSTHAISLMKKENPDLKVFSRAHRWDLYFDQNKYNYLPFRFQTSKYLDTIYSASIEGIQYCKDTWKISKYNNLQLSRLGVAPQKLLPLNISDKIIVSCSNIISVKRVDKIIESLSYVNTKKLKWIHFGTGPNDDKIKALALKLLNKKMDFEFMGRLENNLLLDWYKKNKPDLFINLSYSEGIPVSIMEAMSFGIPCVVSRVGGCVELVKNSVGFSVHVDESAKKIGEIIDAFLNLSAFEKTVIRKNTHSHVLENFNANKNYIEFCKSLKHG